MPGIEEIQSQDLALLLFQRFLQVLVIDLRFSNSDSNGTIAGSFWLHQLATEINDAPNKGSVIFSVCASSILENLIESINPSILVFFDSGAENGPASKLKQHFMEIIELSGRHRWSQFQSICILDCGFEKFSGQFPSFCVDTKCHASVLSPPPRHVSPSETDQHDPPAEIISNLYLGGIQATNLSTFAEFKFRHLVSIGELPLIVEELALNVPYSPLISPSSHSKSAYCTKSSIILPPQSPLSLSTSPDSQKPVVITKRSRGYSILSKLDTVPDSSQWIMHYMFTIEDFSHAPIDIIFRQTAVIIQNALDLHENVLVQFVSSVIHLIVYNFSCRAGVSRSSTVLMAYLITNLGHSLALAFALTFHARKCVKPNDGFWNKLEQLELTEKKAIYIPACFKTVEYQSQNLAKFVSSSSSLSIKQMKLARSDRVDQWLRLCAMQNTR